MNFILTPGQLMNSLCRGWSALHPEDTELPTPDVLRKLLRAYAIEGGSSMILMMGAGNVVHHFALLDYPHFNG